MCIHQVPCRSAAWNFRLQSVTIATVTAAASERAIGVPCTGALKVLTCNIATFFGIKGLMIYLKESYL